MVPRFLKCSLAVLAISLSVISAAHAGCEPISCYKEQITTLYISDHVFLRTSGDESLLNCALQSGVYITLRTEHKHFEAIYAFLLSAYHQREAVTVRIVEGSSGCEVHHVRDDR